MPHDRLAVLNTIADQGLMSLHHHADPNVAFQVIERIFEGGGRVVEFTNRFPQAISAFAQLASLVHDRYPDVVLGAGSIEDPATAALFINAGAEFIVSPGLAAPAAEVCNVHKVPYLPGTMTITEIVEAERLGCEFVKLYPATDPAFVAAVQAPRPWTRIVANGPFGVKDIGPWFEAGVTAIGTMSVAPPPIVAKGQYEQITERVRSILDRVREIRTAEQVGLSEGPGPKER